MNVCNDVSEKQGRAGKEQVHSARQPQMKVNRKHTHTNTPAVSLLPLLSHPVTCDTEKKQEVWSAVLTKCFFSVAFAAIRRYGKDFSAIAEVIGTKTPAQVSFLFLKC